MHADNCVGHNKNNTILHCFLWCVVVGLYRLITIVTKLSPGWCFGLFKQCFRCTTVGCLDDVAEVTDSAFCSVGRNTGSGGIGAVL